MELNYTSAQLEEAMSLLSRYYEIPASKLPGTTMTLRLKEPLIKSITDAYSSLGSCPNDELLCRTFVVLTSVVTAYPEFASQNQGKTLHSQQVRCDLLRLFVLCSTTHEGDEIIIKNRSRSFRLVNDANWLFRDLVCPFLEKHLEAGITLEQARCDLEAGVSHRRGRRVSDPRVPRLLMGTWRMLTDLHGFRTPMPNSLCNFIVRLLQLQGIFPENTDIDALWVRAQLRYLNAKADKLNQESFSGS